MARTLTKEKPIKSIFLEDLKTAIADNRKVNLLKYNSEWKEKPVNIKDFCNYYIKEPLFPIQRKFGLAMTGKNPLIWTTKYKEGHAFWGKGCFSGETKVSLLNGKEISFGKLYKNYKDKVFWVYSIDKDNNIVAGKASNPRITKYIKKLIEIELDNGEKIRCTFNHLFMLRNGKYKKAKNLAEGESLMPLYRKINEKGYEQVYTNKWELTHNVISGYKKGLQTHHDDENRRNNEPFNLKKITQSEHLRIHNIRNNDSAQGKLAIKGKIEKLKNKEYRKKYCAKLKNSMNNPEILKKISDSLKRRYLDKEYKMRFLESMRILHDKKSYRKKLSKGVNDWYKRNEGNEKFELWKKERSRKCNEARWNHKVKSIKIIILDKAIPVYDITVNKYHNFALSSGVFVHNSGKDKTIAKIILHSAYKLTCMYRPQYILREEYGCSIGDDDSIDIINISFNARQANNVFFKKLKNTLLKCKNPNTKKNWFAEKGMDIRDGYGILKGQIDFPNNVTAHSLNSETYTGEGLNTFIALIDEFGQFPVDKAFDMVDSVRQTILSRFNRVGKLALISFMYYNNDPMDIVFKEGIGDPDVYSSKASTFDVNPFVRKKDFVSFYNKNPEKAKMVFDCSGSIETGGYVTKKYMISRCFTPSRENPIKGDLISVKSNGLQTLKFKEWFHGSPGKIYTVRVDLASGKVDKKNDAAGFCLLHPEKMYPKIDAKLKSELAQSGIIIEANNETEMEVTRKGMEIDLAIQIVAPRESEIEFSDVRKFIIRLRDEFGFNISMVTYDGWQSKDSIQLLNNEGMYAEELSVDKNNTAYDTWKELLYQELIKCYPQGIAEREAKELVINDNGKIDHPEKSWERKQMEGTDRGSKDVMDAIVGCVQVAYEKIPLESDIFFI